MISLFFSFQFRDAACLAMNCVRLEGEEVDEICFNLMLHDVSGVFPVCERVLMSSGFGRPFSPHDVRLCFTRYGVGAP